MKPFAPLAVAALAFGVWAWHVVPDYVSPPTSSSPRFAATDSACRCEGCGCTRSTQGYHHAARPSPEFAVSLSLKLETSNTAISACGALELDAAIATAIARKCFTT
jgi:hypothetical protein